MTDDKIVKDSARDPEREALGSTRGGIRAAAGRAARKVAKKVAKKATRKAAQKKTTKKATAAAGRSTKKAGRPAAKPDKSAPAARTRAARSRAATTTSRGSRAPAADSVAATEHGAGAVPLHDSGPPIEAPPPPAPIHPGAAMESMQEHTGGMGSLLALWGPLIIVGFLVLVFRGGEERESTVAASTDAPSQVAMDSAPGTSHGARDGDTMNPAAGARPSTRPAGIPGTAHGGEAFDGGYTMRTSMAGSPVFAGREPGAEIPGGAPGRLYPSPPGPYRDPRYRGLPTGESWSSEAGGEWRWSADGRAGSSQDDGSGAPVQWVQCAPPYYWCPAPSSPAW